MLLLCVCLQVNLLNFTVYSCCLLLTPKITRQLCQKFTLEILCFITWRCICWPLLHSDISYLSFLFTVIRALSFVQFRKQFVMWWHTISALLPLEVWLSHWWNCHEWSWCTSTKSKTDFTHWFHFRLLSLCKMNIFVKIKNGKQNIYWTFYCIHFQKSFLL